MKYKLRPSGSSRWLSCPASLILEETVVVEKRDDMVAAYLGSATHELLERCVKNEKLPGAFKGERIVVFDEEHQNFPYVKTVDQNMVDTINFFLQEVGFPSETAKVFSELEMEHSDLPELRGTADYLRVDGSHALLADLKNGSAIVQVKKRNGEINTQLLAYASMVFDQFPEVMSITLVIIQPNGKTKKKVRSAVIDRQDAADFMARAKKVAKAAGDATKDTLSVITSEGSHCWFCLAKDICPARGRAEINRDFKE